MAAYSLETVLLKWEKGELSPEQAIGQTLLLVQELAERVGNVEKRLMGSRPVTGERPLPEQRPFPEPRPPSPKDIV